MSTRPAAVRLARALRIPVTCTRSPARVEMLGTVGWDGARLHVGTDVPPCDVWHDIAHWLIAYDRSTPDLGTGYPEDEFASALGILLQARVSRGAAVAHARWHSWEIGTDGWPGLSRRLRARLRMGAREHRPVRKGLRRVTAEMRA